MNMNMNINLKFGKRQKRIFNSLIISVILIVIGVVSGNALILGNLLLVAIVIIILPIFLYNYNSYRLLKSMEDQFPNFVRDLADSRRSGMSFKESVKLASRANYGKLSPEIQMMHNKLSWGVPFERVLELFRKRVKKSKIISDSITIIKESYRSGGDVASTLNAIARDILMLKETESERASMLRQNVLIMYGIFFMFLGISIMIIFVMIPMIQNQPTIQTGSFGFAFTSPCEGLPIFPCNLFEAVGLFLGVPTGIANYYISIFFLVTVIQGIFTGLIAGQMGENSITAGSKHALIMTFSGIGTFLLFAKAGLFPI